MSYEVESGTGRLIDECRETRVIMAAAEAIRILIADDHPLVRAGIRSLVQQRSDMIVVAEASTGREAVEKYAQQSPDVVLMDLRMPDLDGVQAIGEINHRDSSAAIVILTSYDGDEDVYQALRSGARGYVLKDDVVEDLITAIHHVVAGRRFIKASVLHKLAERIAGPELTRREIEVLNLVAAGKTNKTIAEQLFISEGTVKAHMKSILAKVGATDRTQAVTIAVRRSIVRLE